MSITFNYQFVYLNTGKNLDFKEYKFYLRIFQVLIETLPLASFWSCQKQLTSSQTHVKSLATIQGINSDVLGWIYQPPSSK